MGDWKQVPVWEAGGSQPLLPSQVHLWNRCETLELNNQANDSEGLPRSFPRASQATRHIAALGFKKERTVIVAVISFSGKLRALYADWIHPKVCCLPGVQGRDVTRR